MNKIVGAVFLSLMFLSSNFVFAQDDLIKNGDFEEGEESWKLYSAEESAITIDNAEFYSGKYSLRFEHHSTESYSSVSQWIDVEPNTYYTVSFSER